MISLIYLARVSKGPSRDWHWVTNACFKLFGCHGAGSDQQELGMVLWGLQLGLMHVQQWRVSSVGMPLGFLLNSLVDREWSNRRQLMFRSRGNGKVMVLVAGQIRELFFACCAQWHLSRNLMCMLMQQLALGRGSLAVLRGARRGQFAALTCGAGGCVTV